MADFFKSNPTALRHCIRFEVLQGTPIEKAYSNICSVIGEEVIDYKKFKIRFNHFSKKKFNDKEQENSCAKILRDDKYALRVCILYESLRYQKDKSSVPVFEVFMNFCKVIGVEDVLKYTEFEFWFYRFLDGEFDLNYERDKDEKIYELMDMPIDVMEEVVKYLDIFDRMKLAKTSRSLQTFVEDQKQFHHTLELGISYFATTVSLSDSVNIEYFWNSVGCKWIFKESETHLRGMDHWKQALLDFKSILKNPKLCLDSLKIGLYVNDEQVFNDLKDELKFTHYLNVENVFLAEYSWESLAEIVPMLKPGYLKTINIISHTPEVGSIKKVFEMEQWKQAKYFKMYGAFFMWPLHHLYHFKKFTVLLEELSVEHIREMKEVLFNSSDFEKCSTTVSREIDMSMFKHEFDNALRENPYIYHYPIDNSTDYFEINAGHHQFEVTRKKR